MEETDGSSSPAPEGDDADDDEEQTGDQRRRVAATQSKEGKLLIHPIFRVRYWRKPSYS